MELNLLLETYTPEYVKALRELRLNFHILYYHLINRYHLTRILIYSNLLYSKNIAITQCSYRHTTTLPVGNTRHYTSSNPAAGRCSPPTAIWSADGSSTPNATRITRSWCRTPVTAKSSRSIARSRCTSTTSRKCLQIATASLTRRSANGRCAPPYCGVIKGASRWVDAYSNGCGVVGNIDVCIYE